MNFKYTQLCLEENVRQESVNLSTEHEVRRQRGMDTENKKVSTLTQTTTLSSKHNWVYMQTHSPGYILACGQTLQAHSSGSSDAQAPTIAKDCKHSFGSSSGGAESQMRNSWVASSSHTAYTESQIESMHTSRRKACATATAWPRRDARSENNYVFLC